MNIENKPAVAEPARAQRQAQAGAVAGVHGRGQKSHSTDAAPSFQSLLTALGADIGAELVDEALVAPDPGPVLTQNATLPNATAVPLEVSDFVLGLAPPELLENTSPGQAAAAPPDALAMALAQPAATLPARLLAAELAGGRASSAVGAPDGKLPRQTLLRPMALAPDAGDRGNPSAPAMAALPTETVPVFDTAQATSGSSAAALSRSAAARFSQAQRVQEADMPLALAAASAAGAQETQLAGLPLESLGAFARGMMGSRDPDRKTQTATAAPSGVAGSAAWAEPGANSAGSSAAATFTLDAGLAAPEGAIAEKAHYWVMRGVQNAELRLDAFGGGQVEVSIAVQGSDAMVEFRSDQPEARRLLQDAMGQLRDLLKSEGMSLSGGFVGTSARQDPQPQGRRTDRQPAIARMVLPQTAASSQLGAPPRQSGSSVDVFV